MATISPKLLEAMRNAASSEVDHAMVNIDGQLQQFPIFRTTTPSSTEVIKYVYLEGDQAAGQIIGAYVADASGDALVSHDMSLTKDDSGLLLAFKISVKAEVAVQ